MKANGKTRAGIIGIGNWGRYGHVPVLQLLPKFEIVALVSSSQEAVEQLLTTGEFTISEAAYRVGFVDQSHLTRHFKRVFELPLRHYSSSTSPVSMV